MRLARGRALLVIAAIAVAALALAAALARHGPEPLPERPPAERPALLLLTSLPLMFGEGFSLEQNGSPALRALERRYRVTPISVTAPAELAKGKLLLMAHPPAQPAEDLVALDAWVRRGGRVLLLADPMLEWPSEHPLGDPLRPAPMFMDTGLLAHWGLRLDAPDVRGPSSKMLAGFEVQTSSPGKLFGKCAISADRFVAHCRIGKGRATIVADADLLNVDPSDDSGSRNLDAVLRELADLERA